MNIYYIYITYGVIKSPNVSLVLILKVEDNVQTGLKIYFGSQGDAVQHNCNLFWTKIFSYWMY